MASEEEETYDQRFFPVLPYGFKPDFDLSGWNTMADPRGHPGGIKLIRDLEVKTSVGEITTHGNFKDMSISFPDAESFIGTQCRWLIFHIKNLNRRVALEVEIEDDKGIPRTIRCSTAQSLARVGKSQCSLPLKLTDGWNKVALDLKHLSEKCFLANYAHANRVRVYANCRIRRIFFSDEHYRDSDLPPSLQIGVLRQQRRRNSVQIHAVHPPSAPATPHYQQTFR